MGYLVTCRLLIEADSEGEAADGVNEILREQQREYAPGSCLIDYAQDAFTPTPIAPDYGEGEAFEGPNLAAAAPAMLAALRDLVAGYGELCDGNPFDPDADNQREGAFGEYWRALDAIALATGESVQ